ncbi:Xanthine and CO dehydrogenases maturation factor, XdhC/CoxF family [hydrothermal vent metagenome]|uniref:Xanthine and CO dehydrogenases maturation factor, XdhC/CoxF family n=1 Tax=hydrothermal vent metagenome TaxID=652676 RepID=A0A3B0SLP6_9ZZZZ
MKLAPQITALLSQEQPLVLVTLCQVQGSAPRDAGASMLVWAQGQTGSIGGGELEYRLTKTAHDMLANGAQLPVLAEYPLGPVLGQCCGGFVRAMLEPLSQNDLHWLRPWLQGEQAVLRELKTATTTLVRTMADAEMVQVLDANQQTQDSLLPLTDCKFVHREPAQNLNRVYIFGGGHIGMALHKLLVDLPFDVSLLDTRRDATEPDSTIINAANGTYFVVVTHSHDLDYSLCKRILLREQVRFCGLIGSQTKRARFVSRLRADGLNEVQIGRLTCPMGLAGIGGKRPEEIAIAIAAQLLSWKEYPPDGN